MGSVFGKPVGTFGRYGSYFLMRKKHMCAGGQGDMVICNYEQLKPGLILSESLVSGTGPVKGMFSLSCLLLARPPLAEKFHRMLIAPFQAGHNPRYPWE